MLTTRCQRPTVAIPRSRIVKITFILCLALILPSAISAPCKPSFKRAANGDCVTLNNRDVLHALSWFAHPPKTNCSNVTTVQDISVCEEHVPKQCVVWSVIASTYCDHFGSLQFEKYWADRGCSVTVFHFYSRFRGNICHTEEGALPDHPNLQIQRYDMWGNMCYNCFYAIVRKLWTPSLRVDVLKIQNREGVLEDYHGMQYLVLSDLFLYLPKLLEHVYQLVLSAPFTPHNLVDHVGREAENGWNMFAAQQLLRKFAAFASSPVVGRNQPLQYDYLLHQARVDPSYSYYMHSFLRVQDQSQLAKLDFDYAAWQPAPPPYQLRGVPPDYCKVPSVADDARMQNWISVEMKSRCHPFKLAVPCIRSRLYHAFIPCPQELMNHLAADYASTMRWCDFNHPAAMLTALEGVDAAAERAFNQPVLTPTQGKRLAFFFTVYTDATFVRRLFGHLYSPKHYYLFHVDPVGSTREFEQDLRRMAANYTNVHFAKSVKIVYGAATATILLTKAMAWFDKHASGWDYFVPLTGSDYPLLPLHRIERIFNHQNPPMPFVMGWTPGTSTHIFRLEKTVPVFETDPLLVKSILAVTSERGKVLGAVPMEFRSGNFGPPLLCNNRSNFYHLDNRFNKSGRIMDTQWLFPRDVFPKRGRAYAEEDRRYALPSFDGVWRVWKKSDPATTGAYDRASIDYIVNSEEGRKYYHFFKQMLLGSEEHYYISLLYNWNRTRSFVQTLSAEIAWNTWIVGLKEPELGGFLTHTHFLTLAEWDILQGFAKRGMMFGRKFSTKKTGPLLDVIDSYILHNSTTDAGLYWPGFFEVDITTPGKQWVAAYRRNQSVRAKKQRAVQQLKLAATGGLLLNDGEQEERGGRGKRKEDFMVTGKKRQKGHKQHAVTL